jgi:anaerobic dimethyl sulfoxide reductase subunit C (anchor subunit)
MNLREWALPVYTILMQLATGALFVLWAIRSAQLAKYGRAELDRVTKHPILILFFTILTAILGAHFHLSRPFLSFLAVGNLGSSWLSREILFTVLFLLSVGGLAALQWFARETTRFQTWLGWIAILFGGANTLCMSLIYLLPTQPIWNSALTTLGFFATTMLLGVNAMFAMLVMDLQLAQVRESGDHNIRTQIVQSNLTWFAIMMLTTAGFTLLFNVEQILWLQSGDELATTSLELLLGLYRSLFILRFGLLIAGVGWLLAVAWLVIRRKKPMLELLGHIYLSFLFVLVGEILGRFLFYAMHVRLGI